MKCRIFIVLVLMFALSPLAMAQDFKMELTPFFWELYTILTKNVTPLG